MGLRIGSNAQTGEATNPGNVSESEARGIETRPETLFGSLTNYYKMPTQVVSCGN